MTGVYNWAKRDPDNPDTRTYDLTRDGQVFGHVTLSCDIPFHAGIVGAATVAAREIERVNSVDRLRLVNGEAT
jgi:hypothetical protein